MIHRLRVTLTSPQNTPCDDGVGVKFFTVFTVFTLVYSFSFSLSLLCSLHSVAYLAKRRSFKLQRRM